MKQAEKPDLTMRIAPKNTSEYWTVQDWENAKRDDNRPRMIEIFEDRLQHRYLDAVEVLRMMDNHQSVPRFGFAILALDCLLIETLAQFYKGLKQSPRNEAGRFFKDFLYKDSFVFSTVFDDTSADLFYRTVRCGIHHQGETIDSTIIKKTGPKPFEIQGDGNGLVIYRDLFHDELVKNEFKTYISCLIEGNKPDLWKSFVKKMDFICGGPEINE